MKNELKEKSKKALHIKVGAKLNIAFGGIIAILIFSTVFNFLNFLEIEEKQKGELNETFNNLILTEEMRLSLSNQGLFLRAYFLENTESNLKNLQASAESVHATTKKLEKIAVDKEVAKELNELKSDFNVALRSAVEAIDNGESEKALELINGPLEEANIELSALGEKMVQIQTDHLEKTKEDTIYTIQKSKMVSIVVVLIGIAIVLMLSFLVKYTIVKPLMKVKRNADSISKGDLSIEDIEVKTKDEINELAIAFNEMKHNLRGLLQGIKENSHVLNTSAEELSASSEDVMTISEDIAVQIESAYFSASSSSQSSQENALAMEETAQGIQRIAESTQVLNSTSINTSNKASDGVIVVEQAKNQMNTIYHSTLEINKIVEKLSKQSEEIGTITEFIKDITDQTNLLSLNASIEAARAGEHGKGFAVVANEVKKLSESSKKAANSISELTKEIKNDTEKVSVASNNAMQLASEGVEVIAHSEEAFNEILSDVETITSQIQEISATTEELSASAEEVTASVNEVANGVQTVSESLNVIAEAMEKQSGNMQEVSKVALKLSESSSALQEETRKFKIK